MRQIQLNLDTIGIIYKLYETRRVFQKFLWLVQTLVESTKLQGRSYWIHKSLDLHFFYPKGHLLVTPPPGPTSK